jgi:hypothetical protein
MVNVLRQAAHLVPLDGFAGDEVQDLLAVVRASQVMDAYTPRVPVTP